MFEKLLTKLTALEARVQLATGKFRNKLLRKIAKLRAKLGLGTASGVATAVAVGTITLAVASSSPSTDTATEPAAAAESQPADAAPMAVDADASSDAPGLAKGRPGVRTVIDATTEPTTDSTPADFSATTSSLATTSSSGSLDEVTLALEPEPAADSDSTATAEAPTTSDDSSSTTTDVSTSTAEPSSDATSESTGSTDANAATMDTDTTDTSTATSESSESSDAASSTSDSAGTTSDAASTTSDAASTTEHSASTSSDAPATSTTSSTTAATTTDSTGSSTQNGSTMTAESPSSTFASLQDVMRIEEDWELVVNEPDQLVSAPQLGTVMTPLKDIEDVYLAFALNHRINPTYTTGGMELQLWYNGNQIGWLSLGNAHFATKGEKVTWTQRLELKNGKLRFTIANGNSKTWGSFGQGDSIHLSVKTNLGDLNDYHPQVSMANSGVTFASNRVASLVLKAVRAYNSQGQLVASQAAPASVFPPQN